MDATWQAVLALVKGRVKSVDFRTWFKPVQPVEMADGVVRLLVKDGTFQEAFAERHEGVLISALEQVLRRPVAVDYLLQEAELFDHPAAGKAAECVQCPERYTFDTFVVGPSNNMAYAAGRAVAERPGKAYNPLFLYGGTGLGKTHLLCAIGHAAHKRNPKLRVLYITSDTYMNDLHTALRAKRMEPFRVKYRDECDLLLVDDVQFLGNRQFAQVEFFHTFNALHAVGKQIVFTSDRFPQELPDVEERLTSRFEWGLIADIKPPEVETRVEILKRKAEEIGLELPDELAWYIAKEVRDNVRELESCLNRLHLEAKESKEPLSLKMVQESLKTYFRGMARRLTPEVIQKAVAQKYAVKVADLTSTSRRKEVALARHVSMYLARKLTMVSFPEIGEKFGGRDHSSVMAGIRKVEKQLRIDGTLAQAVEELEQGLRR